MEEDDKIARMREKYKLKISRGVTMYCVLIMLILAINVSLENINSIRPHGTTAFTMFCIGVVGPATIFLANKNLFNFAKKRIQLFAPYIHFLKKQPTVYPTVWKIKHWLLQLFSYYWPSSVGSVPKYVQMGSHVTPSATYF